MLQKAGGAFELTADANFGTTYGLLSNYFTSRVANPAAAGVVRLAKTDVIGFRNNANGADLPLGINGSDRLIFNSVAVPTVSSTDTFTNKTLTAPIIATISNTGTLTLPTSTDTLVGRATTDTLTNKTLTTPIISTISNTGTLTLPTSTDTLVGKATTDTLTNKTWNGVAIGPAYGGTGVANNAASTLTVSGNFATTLTVTGTTAVTLPTSGTLATTFVSSQVTCDTGNGHGAVNTKIRRYTNSTTTGTDITYADSANNGASFTINTAGLYHMLRTDGCTSTITDFGFSVNSNQLTTPIFSITTANFINGTENIVTNRVNSVSAVARLAVNDVIRPHGDGVADTTTGTQSLFRIIRIG